MQRASERAKEKAAADYSCRSCKLQQISMETMLMTMTTNMAMQMGPMRMMPASFDTNDETRSSNDSQRSQATHKYALKNIHKATLKVVFFLDSIEEIPSKQTQKSSRFSFFLVLFFWLQL